MSYANLRRWWGQSLGINSGPSTPSFIVGFFVDYCHLRLICNSQTSWTLFDVSSVFTNSVKSPPNVSSQVWSILLLSPKSQLHNSRSQYQLIFIDFFQRVRQWVLACQGDLLLKKQIKHSSGNAVIEAVSELRVASLRDWYWYESGTNGWGVACSARIVRPAFLGVPIHHRRHAKASGHRRACVYVGCSWILYHFALRVLGVF